MKADKMQHEQVSEITAAGVSTVASYTASGSLVVMGLTMHDAALIVGMVLGLGTFLVNWYYKHKEYTRGNDSESAYRRKP